MVWIFLGIIAAIILWFLNLKPSNDRDWSLDQMLLPFAEIKGNMVTVHNIRNFKYKSTTDYTQEYYDATVDIDTLKKCYYIVEPFEGAPGAAHVFVSFEFENNRFIALSIEIRKKKGDVFSPIKGFFKQYEIMYVAADERDVIKLRSNFRKDQVYVYPMKATPEGNKKVFLSMIEDMNVLTKKPEFYNTVFNNCLNRIIFHVNQVAPGHIPWHYTFIFPEQSDKYALKLGLINTPETDIEKVRTIYNINARAEIYADDPDFSLKIRRR